MYQRSTRCRQYRVRLTVIS